MSETNSERILQRAYEKHLTKQVDTAVLTAMKENFIEVGSHRRRVERVFLRQNGKELEWQE